MRGICLDMDGVIVNSEIHWRQVSSEFLAEIIPNWGAAEQQSILGMSVTKVHEKLVVDHGLGLSFAEFLRAYQGLSTRIYGELCTMFDGVPEFLERFVDLPVALVSSAPRSWMEIVQQRFSLAQYFDLVVGAEDVQGKVKPLPDAYELAVRGLGLLAADCLAIEDSHKGVRSASSAGLRCLGYRNGFNATQDLSEADAEVSDFALVDAEFVKALF